MRVTAAPNMSDKPATKSSVWPPFRNPVAVNLLSGSDIKNYSVDWVIENFRLIEKPMGVEIRSPSFYTSEDSKQVWYLSVYPNGCNKENEGNISLFLNPQFDATGVIVKFSFSLMKDKVRSHTIGNTHTFNLQTGYGFHKMLERKTLLTDENELLANGNLKILCELQILQDVEPKSAIKGSIANSGWKASELMNMMQDEESSDITIVVNEEEFKVHKVVLSARSPVFAGMFKHKMQESYTNVVKVGGVEPDAMREGIRYMYTGMANLNRANVEEVLRLADRYDLDGLRDLCALELEKTLTAETAVRLLIMSDLYSVPALREAVLGHIALNAKDVLTRPEWRKLQDEKSHLVTDVLSNIVSDVFFSAMRTSD